MKLTFLHLAKGSPAVGLTLPANSRTLPEGCNQINVPATEVMVHCMPTTEQLAARKMPADIAAERIGAFFQTTVAFRSDYRGVYQYTVGAPQACEVPV